MKEFTVWPKIVNTIIYMYEYNTWFIYEDKKVIIPNVIKNKNGNKNQKVVNDSSKSGKISFNETHINKYTVIVMMHKKIINLRNIGIIFLFK